jgi:hypothetical protein
VNHFQACRPFTGFTETGDMNTSLKLRLLLSRKMKETQCDLAAAVVDANQQVATPTKCHFSQQYFARDQASLAWPKRADFDHLRSVLVSQWQQEKKVFDAIQAKPLELFRECGPDAVKYGQC